MNIPNARFAGRFITAFLALAATAALAGEAFVDMDSFNQQRALWEGTAATNRLMQKEVDRLRVETARLEPLQQSNIELQARLRDLNEIAGGIMSNNFIEWHRDDGKTFIAKLTGDDGEHAEMTLTDGRAGPVDRVMLADADIELLNLLKSWTDSNATGASQP